MTQMARIVAGLSVAGLVLVGCASTSTTSTATAPGSTAAPTSTATSSASATPGTSTSNGTSGTSGTSIAGGTSSTNEFCAQYAALIKQASTNAVTKPGYLSTLQATWKQMSATAPAAIQSDMAAIDTQVQAAKSIDELPSTSAAQNNLDTWVKANCSQFAGVS